MSRNEIRKKRPKETTKTTADPTQASNVINMSFTMPTEIVDLPSKGRFYPDDHPLHGVTQVEIKYMTAKEEDILTSPSLLRNGQAIDRLLQSVILSPKFDTKNILVCDRNMLLISSRITGYGEDYETSMRCPHCSSTFEHTFNLSELSVTESNQDLPGVEYDGHQFLFDLPKLKAKIGIRPLTQAQEESILTAVSMRIENGLDENALTEKLRTMITSVNGSDSQNLINELVNVLPATDSRTIRQVYNNVTPQVDTRQKVTCTTCSLESEVEVPFTADFFWPDG